MAKRGAIPYFTRGCVPSFLPRLMSKPMTSPMNEERCEKGPKLFILYSVILWMIEWKRFPRIPSSKYVVQLPFRQIAGRCTQWQPSQAIELCCRRRSASAVGVATTHYTHTLRPRWPQPPQQRAKRRPHCLYVSHTHAHV